MLKSLVKKVLGDRHAREAKKLQPILDEIDGHYRRLESLSDDEFLGKSD